MNASKMLGNSYTESTEELATGTAYKCENPPNKTALYF